MKIFSKSNKSEIWQTMFYDCLKFHSFIRKGEAGGWRNELSPQLAEKIDHWTKQKVIDDEKKILFEE
jgi:hypothetical protein